MLLLLASAGVVHAQTSLPQPDPNSVMLGAQPWTSIETLPPPIRNAAVVDAPLADVWNSWTTSEGLKSFVGLGAEVEPRPGGLFRVIFVPGAKTPITRGNDGRVIAIEPMRMLSVTWMTPMHMAALTGNSTLLTLYFTPADGGRRTRIDLVNTGYGTGPDWHAAYEYNVKGWDRVLSGFEARFRQGPIDWDRQMLDMQADRGFSFWRDKLRNTAAGAAKPTDNQ